MTPIIISKQTARRFVLGKQGLWPGRRWKGKKGAAQANLDPPAADEVEQFVLARLPLK